MLMCAKAMLMFVLVGWRASSRVCPWSNENFGAADGAANCCSPSRAVPKTVAGDRSPMKTKFVASPYVLKVYDVRVRAGHLHIAVARDVYVSGLLFAWRALEHGNEEAAANVRLDLGGQNSLMGLAGACYLSCTVPRSCSPRVSGTASPLSHSVHSSVRRR